MSYPRKRALLACDFCRQRKRRCDGRKPVCGNCAEAEADCHYQELPIQRLMSGNIPSAMAKRLERIENLLKIHSDAIASLQTSNYNCTATPPSEPQPPPLNALDQSHDDIEHDIPAVLTYLATSGQHHNYNHNKARRTTPAPGDGGIRKDTCCKLSQHSVTPDRLRDPKISHVPSPPNSTSSAASPAASVTESSPKLVTTAASNIGQLAASQDIPKPKASASSLLSFPTLKSLLGEFPEDYLFRIELQRASSATMPVQPVELSFLNRDVTDLLVTTFFSVVHPCHPLFVRREMFFQTYEKVVTRGLAYDAESALCLVVFALGVMASSPSVASLGATTSVVGRRDTRKELLEARNSDSAGMEYFLPAQQIMIMLDGLTLTGDLMLSQSLLLGSIYLSFVGQPLKCWKLVHQASKQLQLLNMHRKHDLNKDSLLQAACECYSIESDILVEFNLPPSGIAQLIDTLFFSQPYFLRDSCMASDEFLSRSEILIQRITNRARETLYSPAKESQLLHQPDSTQHTSSLSLPEMLSLASDSERQLALWYDSLPPNVQPDLGLQATGDDREMILRMRYHEARQAILKPFVLLLASPTTMSAYSDMASPDIPHVVLDKARICLESCRLYIRNAGELLKKRTRYSWSVCQFSLNAVLLCTIASVSPHLAHLVPDVSELQQLVIDGASAWAVPESGSEAGVWIVADIGRRQRYCLSA